MENQKCFMCGEIKPSETFVNQVYADHWPEPADIEECCEDCAWEVFDRTYNS